MAVSNEQVSVAIIAFGRALEGTARTSADEMLAWRAALEAAEEERVAPAIRMTLDGRRFELRNGKWVLLEKPQP